jgi:biotin synthase
MVTATRGPSAKDLDVICGAVARIKEELPGLSVCTSLGLLGPEEARRLAAAGVDRFNHNLETTRARFSTVCSTHTWEDRVATVREAKAAGMEACCGGILGMGETLEERVELAMELAALEVDSVPVNLLDARAGTPLEDRGAMNPQDALRGLAMFRFFHPKADLRVAGGREVVLGPMQALALYPANSLFVEGYLTTGGQGEDADRAMIEAAGFEVVAEAP